MLDLVQVRSFVAVATELHFTRAAVKLGLTQPPLSRHIRMLEEYLGVQLFERSRHGVNLTHLGHRFLIEARLLLAKAEAAEASIRDVPQEPEGVVRLGFYGATAFRFLPQVIVALKERYPRVELDLKELDAVGQSEAFSFGKLDLGLVRPSVQPDGLKVDVVLKERLLLAMRADHPLARRARIRLVDIDGLPFIGYSTEASYMHDLVHSVLAAEGTSPLIAQRVSHAQAILSLVGAGLGVSILPEHASHAGRDGVVFRPIMLKGYTALTHLVSAEDPRRPVIGLVREVIRETGATMTADRS